MNNTSVSTPLPVDIITKLSAGDSILLSGVVYAARDAAHRRMVKALEEGEKLPFDIAGQTLYYMGPSPSRPGRETGAAGPTTSGRMDIYTPPLLVAGLKVMIGKGDRSPAVKEAMRRYGAVYLAATGGAGALLAGAVKKAEVVAYADLGPEAVLRLRVEDFPAVVAYDSKGGDLFARGRAAFKRIKEERGLK